MRYGVCYIIHVNTCMSFGYACVVCAQLYKSAIAVYVCSVFNSLKTCMRVVKFAFVAPSTTQFLPTNDNLTSINYNV